VEKRSVDYDFLVQLATAALGGKSSEEQVGVDTGEGIEEMTAEQEANLRAMLGADFNTDYGNNESS